MKTLDNLLENNKKWVAKKEESDPKYFKQFETQSPEYLWIGCADSRVPASQILGLEPGDMFVHRNIANVVSLSDVNCMSAVQYAVEVLKVKHVIICGHLGCGGVKASMNDDNNLGVVDNWLCDLNLVYEKHQEKLAEITDESERWAKLCEINVMEQVANLSKSVIIKRAWDSDADLTIHGWIYDINTGLIRDLEVASSSRKDSNQLKSNLKK